MQLIHPQSRKFSQHFIYYFNQSFLPLMLPSMMLILRITSNSTTSKNSMHDKFIINNIIIKKKLIQAIGITLNDYAVI